MSAEEEEDVTNTSREFVGDGMQVLLNLTEGLNIVLSKVMSTKVS